MASLFPLASLLFPWYLLFPGWLQGPMRRDPGAGQSWRWSDGLGVRGPGGSGAGGRDVGVAFWSGRGLSKVREIQ